jgi:hypothetical protein
LPGAPDNLVTSFSVDAMLHRPPQSPSARRSRARRARQKAGIVRDYKIRTAAVERELAQIVNAFVETWLGPVRK